MRPFVFIGILLLFAATADADSIQQVRVAIKINVYTAPAFKSKLLEKLPARSVISFSTAKIIGKGGLGVFYKVKTPSGKIGYIIDSDLVAAPMEEESPQIAVAPTPVPQPPPSQLSKDREKEDEEEKPAPRPTAASTSKKESEPPTPATHWGASLATIDYSETFADQNQHQSQLFIGVRRTRSPRQAWRFGSDFSLAVSPQAPRFLASAGAYGATSGYIVMGEGMIHMPMSSGALAPYLGVGALLVHANYKTNYANLPYENAKTRFGGVVNLGVGYDFTKYSVRLDVNYYIDGTPYLGEKLTFQTTF